MGISLLDDELMSLGKSSKTSATSMLCVLIVVTLCLSFLGLSEGTPHTPNPASQPEDSTTWDSFQVRGELSTSHRET
jgi:hypothetical protein